MQLKKILIYTASLLLCCNVFASNPTLDNEIVSILANADNDSVSGSLGDNCKYSFDSATGTLTISGSGSTPNCSGGYSSIPWNSNKSYITSIVVQEGVTSIGNYMFRGCSNVESVSLPSTLVSIGENAFQYCSSLVDITIPSSVETISSGAFIECTSLTNILVDSDNPNYTSVGGVLFSKDKTQLVEYPCGSSRTEYTIPSSVTSIESAGFAGSVNLVKVTMPNSVTTVGGGVFYGCTALTDVTLSNQIESLPYYYQYFYYADWSGFFQGCTSLSSIELPSSVKEIGAYAFSDCSSFKEFNVGDYVTTIDLSAFAYSNNITTITLGKSVSSISSSAFDYCSGLANINVSKDNENYSSIDGVVFSKDKTKLIIYPANHSGTSYTIPSCAKKISSYAFYSNKNLEEVTIPKTVTSIGNNAFTYSNISTVNFEDVSSVNIESRAFSGTPYYYNLKTDDGFYITEDGILLGYDGTATATLEVPDTVKYVTGGTFGYYFNAKTVIFNSDCYLATDAFRSCSSLQKVVVNGNCSTGYQPFDCCSNLTDFTVSGTLTCYGDLEYGNSLTNVSYNRTALNYDDILTEERNLLATKTSYTFDNVEYSTYSNRSSYYLYGNVDYLQEVSDVDGNIYAVYGYNDVATMVAMDGSIVNFNRDGYTFGTATIGDDNYLYIMWGKDISDSVISESLDEENVIVDKYSLDGTLVGSLGLPVSYTNAQFPFDAGNANISYNDGYIGLIFDTEWLQSSDGYHHQGSDFVLIDADSMETLGIDTLSISHSFGVAMQPNPTYGFNVLQLSDAGPRGINLMRYYTDVESIWSTPTNDYTRVYHCSGQYGTNQCQLDGNYTYTYMGGFARSNSTFAVVGKSERVYTSDVYYLSGIQTYNYDVFVKIVDDTFYDSASADCMGENRLDESTGEVADTNIIWLTQCNENEQAGNVKVVTLPSGAYCVLWESLIDGKFDSVKYVIMDECGNIIRQESTIANARLSDTSIQPIVQGNTLTWAVANSNLNTIDFYSVDLNGDEYSSMAGDLDNDSKVTYMDLLILKKYVLGAIKDISPNGDLNGDGSINILDVIQLKNQILDDNN